MRTFSAVACVLDVCLTAHTRSAAEHSIGSHLDRIQQAVPTWLQLRLPLPLRLPLSFRLPFCFRLRFRLRLRLRVRPRRVPRRSHSQRGRARHWIPPGSNTRARYPARVDQERAGVCGPGAKHVRNPVRYALHGAAVGSGSLGRLGAHVVKVRRLWQRYDRARSRPRAAAVPAQHGVPGPDPEPGSSSGSRFRSGSRSVSGYRSDSGSVSGSGSGSGSACALDACLAAHTRSAAEHDIGSHLDRDQQAVPRARGPGAG